MTPELGPATLLQLSVVQHEVVTPPTEPAVHVSVHDSTITVKPSVDDETVLL